MRYLTILLATMVSGSVYALPLPKKGCNELDLQVRYARLYAAGSFCGKDENSSYANKLSNLFINDQEQCNLTSTQIDPNDQQVEEAFTEIKSFSKKDKTDLCKTLDKQMDAIKPATL